MPSPLSRRRATAACAALALPFLLLPGLAQPAAAADPAASAGHGDPSALADPAAIEPRTADYGRYIDMYRQNTEEFADPATNPAIGVLSGMLDLWQPGQTWNDGTKRNAPLLDENIRLVEEITQSRTEEQGDRAWVSDRRNQNVSTVEGLGDAAEAFRALANVGTTIPDEVPADATTVGYDDEGNVHGVWADQDAPLGSVVQLVDTVRGEWATANRAKDYYQYMRPFRWSDDVVVLPELLPQQKPEEEAASDGGFPSGHTNAAFLAALALASAVPERADELVLRAAELGHSRVEAGMHSPLDVIGGRILATAIAAATLADPENAALVAEAGADADALLGAEPALDADRAAYRERMDAYLAETGYGFETVAETGVAAVVPAGAEELVRARYPYLDDAQLRWVLLSTALDSGAPLVDDAEGWGRINLLAAVNGYGAFDRDVAVSFDGTADGYAAADVWRNDIGGAGGLRVGGSGSLTLAGENSFAGGVLLEGGDLAATTASALGTGDVALAAGTLTEQADGALAVGGDLVQQPGATLALTVEDAASPALTVAGTATLGGALTVDLSALDAVPARLPLLSAAEVSGTFDTVDVTGLPDGYRAELRVEDGVLVLVDAAAPAPAPEPTDTPVPTAEPTDAPQQTAEPTASPAPTVAPDDDLAPTGVDLASVALLLGGLATGAGALLLALRRRRSVR